MDFLGIIQEVNKDCGLSKNIKLSRFTESTDVGEKDVGKKDVGKKDTNRWYKSLEESIIYNWCLHDDCILSLDYFKSENDLNKHIEINHK